MMYSKTLIILTLLLAVALIYLVYDCKCDRENFQNETSAVTTVNTIPNSVMNYSIGDEGEGEGEGEEEVEGVEGIEELEEEIKMTTPSVTLTEVTLPKPEENTMSKHTFNYTNVPKKTFSDMENIEFYEFKSQESKIDITNTDLNNFTFSVLIKPTLSSDTNKKEEENRKKIIASSNSWYIELKSNVCKFVYNGVAVESKIIINFEKYYLVSAVVSNSYIAILVNGNETRKEYNVPEISTKSIKLGLSGKNTNRFNGFMGNIDIVSGNLTSDEICERNKFCSTETPTCSFKAAGKTRMDCVKLCDNDDNCSSVECQSICLDCKEPRNCEWLSLDENDDYREVSVPDAPEIRALAHGDGQIVLDWSAPNNNGSPIKNYAIIVNESFNKNNGVTFRQLADTKCTACEYVINGLKNRIYYDVSVAAVNDIGISDFSNIESVAPMGKMRNSEVSNLLIEDDAEIENSARKIISDELNDQICEGVLSQSRDSHYLNKKRVRFAEQVKEELVPKLFK